MSNEKCRRKVLVSAYACEPGSTSEQEVGWKWATLLSELNDVYVLTRTSNRETIENYAFQNKIDLNFNIVYYDLPQWARKWKRGERGLYLYYTLWQIGAYRKAKLLNKEKRFDIVHYLTFGSLMLPNFMWLLPNRFVLGPVGGGENTPLKFIGNFTKKGMIAEVIRHVIQSLQKINPLFLLQCRSADQILVRTHESYKMIPRAFHHKTEVMLETGVPEELLGYRGSIAHDNAEIRIVTVGRLIHSKINILTLKVILHFKKTYGVPFKFYVVGDGYERSILEEFCIANDLTDEVVFTGWVSRGEVLEHLSSGDIYYSTTFKEGGSWAFFEAVTMGLPVVCLKISGPDLIVADGCGIKVSPTKPEDVICNLSKGLYRLAVSSGLRAELSANAKIALLENMTWGKMMKRIEKIYDELDKERAGK